MKILFMTYPLAYQNPGGGEMVIDKLRESLIAKGIQVDLFNQWEHKISDYDIVHYFSTLSWETWDFISQSKVKLVLTPTSWPNDGQGNLLKVKTKRFIREQLDKKVCLDNYIHLPDLILPTTQLELNKLVNYYDLDPSKLKVLYNGITPPPPAKDINSFQEKYQLKDYLLYVGTIARNKGLDRAIELAKRVKLPLAVVGQPRKGEETYFENCKDASDETIHYIGRLENGSDLLWDAFRGTRCLIVPSDFETCSLVALEAGSLGNNVLITQNGGTREVFGEFVSFFDPENLGEAEKSLRSILSTSSCNRPLESHIMNNFLWGNISQRLLDFYRKLANS